MMRAAILLPLAALLTIGAATPPRDLCLKVARTANQLCTPVYFYPDSAELPPSTWPILDLIVATVQDNAGAQVVLAGYTDANPDAEGAVALSKQMADNTRDYLVANGVDKGAITVEAYGTANPRERNKTGKPEVLNKRVEIWVNWE